jgi:arsenate reductase (glutaredoxin)
LPRAQRVTPSYTVSMALTVYHYPACSTCRRALKWLDQHGIVHNRVDIVQHPPSRAELQRILDETGGPMRSLFNTSGQSYRDGNFKERLPSLSAEAALTALEADGKLIKRPLAIGDGVALVGFEETRWAAALR